MSTLILVFLAQGLAFIGANSQTFDEAAHLGAGYSYLATGDFRLNPEHPPLIKELAALPLYLSYRLPFNADPKVWRDAEEWQIGRDFLYGSPVPHDRLLALGRMPNLLLGAALVGLIGWWAHRLWGGGAALTAAGLAALDPNLVAHASLITTDLGITLFGFLTLYLLWEYTVSPSRGLLVAAGLALGLAFGAKYSAVLMVAIVGSVIGLHALCAGAGAPRGGHGQPAGAVGARLAWAGMVLRRVLICALLLIPLFYFIYGCHAWSVGLRSQFERQPRPAFFFGEHTLRGGRLSLLVVFLIKTPAGTLLILVASLVLFRAGRRLGRHEALFLLLPPALFVAALALSPTSNSLRYLLPVYPFLFVAASRLATIRPPAGRAQGWLRVLLVGLPLALTATSSLRVAPHQLAYFNELVGGPGEGYRYLSDSNLDWGQDLKELHAYLEREGIPMIYFSYFGTAPPASYGIHYQYLPGFFDPLQQPPPERMPPSPERELLAISVTNLHGTYLPEDGLYHWLYQRTPVAKIGYSIYVYDLTGDADAHRQLAEVYRRCGLPDDAGLESQKARPSMGQKRFFEARGGTQGEE